MFLPSSEHGLFHRDPILSLLANSHHSRTDQDLCFPKVIGYKPAVIMEEIDHTTFSHASSDTADALTNAFVLHPIACGLAFIAGLCALGGVIGGVIGTMIAAVAWIITLVVMAIDFAAFGVSATLVCDLRPTFLTRHCNRSSKTTSIPTVVVRMPTTRLVCGPYWQR